MAGWLLVHMPVWSHQPTLNSGRSRLCHREGRDRARTQQPTPENPPTSPPSSTGGGICACRVSWGVFFFFFLFLFLSLEPCKYRAATQVLWHRVPQCNPTLCADLPPVVCFEPATCYFYLMSLKVLSEKEQHTITLYFVMRSLCFELLLSRCLLLLTSMVKAPQCLKDTDQASIILSSFFLNITGTMHCESLPVVTTNG